jgi:Protein of unknown function (DUF3016)
MNRKTFSVIAILGLLGAGTILADDADKSKTVKAKVTVTFDHPDKFTDVKDAYMPTDKGRDAILDQIRLFVEAKAASYLGAGQSLEVKFTEIDLAGDFEPQRGAQFIDVRILKDIYPPRLDLEFKLTGADGKVLSEGKRQLRDPFYLQRLLPFHDDPLCYEKDILNDWLRTDIKLKAAPAR